MSKELTTEMLEELRTQIKSYFEAYYSALRNEIAGHDASGCFEEVPQTKAPPPLRNREKA